MSYFIFKTSCHATPKINFLLEKENESNWKKLMIDPQTLTEDSSEPGDIKFKIRNHIFNNLVDSLRVLFEEISVKEASGDLKEKSKVLLKLLYSKFSS